MDLEPLLRLWRANDALFDRVEASWWGAVVSDRRFPKIHDVNYARVESRQPVRLSEVEEVLLPAMTDSGSERPHVVIFHAEDQTGLLAEAGTRGERIVWDLVMEHPGAEADDDDPRVHEVADPDEAFWRAYRASLEWFGVVHEQTLDQLHAMERDVFVPAGRRWFAAAIDQGIDALAGLVVVEGVGYIDHVVTFPRARRHGLARALTRRSIAEATAAGADRTYLLAEPGSSAAGMYRALGFGAVTQIPSWVSEPAARG